MTSLVNEPIGSTGNITVTESGGVVTVVVSENIASVGIQAGLTVSLSGAMLLNVWAQGTTNATLKAMLAEAATLIGALPA